MDRLSLLNPVRLGTLVAQEGQGEVDALDLSPPRAGPSGWRLRNLLADLAADRVVLLSTHIVSDVESVAADITVMAGGRLVLRGSSEDLLARAHGRVWEMTAPPGELPQLRDRCPVSKMVRAAVGVKVRLLPLAAPVADAAPVVPDLEDAYLTIVHSASPRTSSGARQ